MTEHPYRKTAAMLWGLAWPIAITGQLAVLAEAVVIYWLGRLLGPDALAVEATLRPALMCATWFLLSIGVGVSVLVARSVGAKDRQGLAHIASGLALVVVAWALLAALVLPLAGVIFDALASPQVPAAELRRYGLPALLLMLPSLALLQVLLFAASGAGWTRLSLVRMVIDLVVTAALVPLFVEVLGFGLPGAPLGQALSQLVMIAVVWRALHAQRERRHLGNLDAPRASWSRKRFAEILDIGLPPQVARIAMFAAYTYLLQRVAGDGKSAVIGFGLGLMIFFFSLTVSGSVGRATGIALGQRIGARDEAGARRAIRTGLGMGVAISCVVAVIIVALASPLVSIFVGEAAAIANGAHTLRILALALPFLGISQVFLFAFTAVKASKRAGIAGIVADVIGIGFVLAWPGEHQLDAAAWSIVVSNGVRAIAFVLLGRVVIGRAIST